MLIERQKRMSRVRFKHPIRVVTLEGQPRVIRTLTANVSRKGLFLRMPEPLPLGTKVALSLEAGGRALALAQAEVVWGRVQQSQLPGRFPGCGVRFTEFMHPRAQELVDYLVHNLDRGKPLMLAPPERRWMRYLPPAAGVALVACAALAVLLLWPAAEPELEDESSTPRVEVVAAPPIVHPVTAVAVPAPSIPAEPLVVAAEPLPAPTKTADAPAQPIAVAPASPPAQTLDAPPARILEQPAPAAAVPPPTPTEVAAPSGERGPPLTGGAARPPPADAESAPGKTAALPAAPDPARKSATAAPLVQKGSVKLPSGAAPSLTWTLAGAELRLSPELLGQAQVTRAFVLAGPPRAVFDISGSPPKRSHVVPVSPPYASAVRLGKQPSGTRIVIDLDSAPKRTSQDGSALVLSF